MDIYSTQEKSAEKLLETNARNRTATAVIEYVNNLTTPAPAPRVVATGMGLAIAASRRGYARADLGDIKEPSKTKIRDSVMNNVNEEKKATRRLVNWNLALSILALLFTAIFSVIGYFSTKQLMTLTSNTTDLASTAVRNSDISVTISNLTSSTAFRSYIATSQKQASLNDPPLILPDVRRGYELTSDGKMVLNKTNLWQDITSTVKENPQAPTNEIILLLGVDRLYNESVNEKVTINQLVGTVATQIEQSR